MYFLSQMEWMGFFMLQLFNIDVVDLYCEWQYWVSFFDIYLEVFEFFDEDDKVQ